MKKILYIIIAFGFIFSGCKKEFLDKESLSDISDGNFWNSKADAELALMGCYDGFQDISLYKGNGTTSGAGIASFDAISDDAYSKSSWHRLQALAYGTYDPTSWGNDQIWKACYNIISRTNEVIKQVPEIESLSVEDSKLIVAEAKVLRATIYNLLAMTYADVPLITEPLKAENAQVAKSTKSEIMSFIIADLEACYQDLPEKADKWGRLGQGAALGILARTYLYTEEWSNAATTAQKVIDIGYTLFPDYSTLFTPGNEQNDEVIFPISFEYGLGGEGGAWMKYYSSRMYIRYRTALPSLVNEFYCTDGLPTSTSPLFNSSAIWENRDPRLQATVTSYNWPNWPPTSKTEPEDVCFANKYIAAPEIKEQTGDSPQDFYLIRFAHVLLIKAEALAQQGADAEIYTLINQLRARVSMPAIEDVEGAGLSQTELLDIVKHERRVETAFEFLRYFDIKRWDEIQEKYNYYNAHEYDNYLGVPGDSYYGGMKERVWLPKYEKMPIPQAELDANKALVQHDGY
ncbi:MAG: RagB/SusD family nutrient uptake outer membrane protein [Bacteroidetes bacterium]|nr:MAG: RagB/SusD family nutrient uptake outer membrane protein [Bacteroidota bacterium]